MTAWTAGRLPEDSKGRAAAKTLAFPYCLGILPAHVPAWAGLWRPFWKDKDTTWQTNTTATKQKHYQGGQELMIEVDGKMIPNYDATIIDF